MLPPPYLPQLSAALSTALPPTRLRRLVRKAVSLASSPDLASFMTALDDAVGEQRSVNMLKVCGV